MIMNLYNYPDILTTDEVCEILCISKSNCLKLLNAGAIKAFKINNSKIWKVPKKALIEFIQWRLSFSP